MSDPQETVTTIRVDLDSRTSIEDQLEAQHDELEMLVRAAVGKPAQLSFEGHAITGITESLRSFKVHKHDVPYREQFSYVEGWFKGTVRRVIFDGSGDAETGREQVIEITEWGVE